MNVFIIAALTADGFIAKNSHHLADWTSKEDKKLFVELTKRAGVMVMGSNQFGTINRALPGRKTIVYTRKADQPSIENVEYTTEEPVDLIKRLESEGYKEIAICGGSQIYDLFLSARVVNDLYLTYEPVLFGTGLQLLTSDIQQKVNLKELKQLNDQVFLAHYTLDT